MLPRLSSSIPGPTHRARAGSSGDGRDLCRDPDHAHALGSPGSSRRPRRGHGRSGLHAQAQAPVLAKPDEFYPGMAIRPYEAGRAPRRRRTVEVADITFATVGVPGHSPGHIGYYADGALFSGDVLFASSVGRTDLPFSDWDTLVESIRSLMAEFPPDTVVYSGHGPETTLGTELAATPSSRSSAPREVRGAAGTHDIPPVRAASLATGDRGGRASVRAVRLPPDRARPRSRTRSSSRALRDKAPTWCRRRCTRSRTGRDDP